MRITTALLVLQIVLQPCAWSVNLDIAAIINPEFILESYPECTLIGRVYRAKKKLSVYKVLHRGGVLWTKEENEECINVQVFYRDKVPLFLHIVFARDNAFEDAYYVYGNKWEACTENAFREALEKERIQTLKIDSPNPLLDICYSYGNPVYDKIFTSKRRCKITRVEENGNTIWEAKEGEHLSHSRLLLENNRPKLLTVNYSECPSLA